MIFKDKLCQKVLDGTKTQTRRLVKGGDYTWRNGVSTAITEVCDFHNRLKWKLGRTYAVQPGRGKHAVGRIGIRRIRRECLNAINHDDAQAEGVGRSIAAFAELWDSIHPKGKRWIDNPEVWVLEFKLVEP